MQSQVPRWRWWIHFLLIGGYFFPGLIEGLYFTPRHPLLMHSGQGLLIVCGLNLVIFTIVFLLGWLASRASSDEWLLRWRPGWWVVPLGVGYSIAIRLGLAVTGFIVVLFLLITQLVNVQSLGNFALQNPPRIDRLIDVGALRTNRAYYWLSLTLVSFVTAGLREELWRAATLAGMRALWAGRIYVPHRREHCHRLNRGRVWRCSFADGRSCRRRRRSDRHFPRHHLNHPPIDLAGGHCPRFIRRNHFCAAATHRKQGPGASSLGGLRCALRRFLQP